MPERSPKKAPVLLVAYGTGPMSDAQLHLACRSANDIGGTVHILHVIERSRHIPLTAPLTPDEEARVHRVLDRAEHIATSHGVRCYLDAVRATAVGLAIVAAAQEHQARVIFLGLRDRDRAAASVLLSGTVRQVLQNAPCPVQIGYLPSKLPDDFARDKD